MNDRQHLAELAARLRTEFGCPTTINPDTVDQEDIGFWIWYLAKRVRALTEGRRAGWLPKDAA